MSDGAETGLGERSGVERKKLFEIRVRPIPATRAIKIMMAALLLLSGVSLCITWVVWNMYTSGGEVILRETNTSILLLEISFFASLTILPACIVVWIFARRAPKQKD